MRIVNISATLEEIVAECVGDAPEAVKLKDWRGISLRMLRLLDERGLLITTHPQSR